MTQLTISNSLAETIAETANGRGCSSEQLLETLFAVSFEIESYQAFAAQALTSREQVQIMRGIEEAQHGSLLPGEVAMRKLNVLIEELESR